MLSGVVGREWFGSNTSSSPVASKSSTSQRCAEPIPRPLLNASRRGEAVIHFQVALDRNRVTAAVRPDERHGLAAGHVRHADDVVGGEVRRLAGPAVHTEIAGGGDQKSRALRQMVQLHRAVRERPQTESNVDALLDEVDALVGQTEVDLNAGDGSPGRRK